VKFFLQKLLLRVLTHPKSLSGFNDISIKIILSGGVVFPDFPILQFEGGVLNKCRYFIEILER